MAAKGGSSSGKNSGHSHIGYRSEKSGRFVTDNYGKGHPDKVTREHIPNPGRGDVKR